MNLYATLAAGCALLSLALAQRPPGVSPSSVSLAIDPGSVVNVVKNVTTLEIPPKPDIVFLADVTGSMSGAINNIKTNLKSVIDAVSKDPSARFAVVSFGDLDDANGFDVHQDLTDSFGLVQAAIDSLEAAAGGDLPEDWINALFEVSAGDAVTFRDQSSRIVVLVGDATSKDPSNDHTMDDAIDALNAKNIRVVAVDVSGLDGDGQATRVTEATGGSIVGTNADEVTEAIISGLQNLDVTVKPDVSCDHGLKISFKPETSKVRSGGITAFNELVEVDSGASLGDTLECTVTFLLNDTPGGDAFVQSVSVKIGVGCNLCDPDPRKNKCDITTSCAPTPYGTMCLTRPGYKADGADDEDTMVQWRLDWPTPFHDHRVAVKPGIKSNTLCSPDRTGPDLCKEVLVAECPIPKADARGQTNSQKILGAGEL